MDTPRPIPPGMSHVGKPSLYDGPIFVGYDGRAYRIGDRVELHPGTDLWMQGARYGVVVGCSLTPLDRVKVKLDKLPRRKFSGPEERFKKLV